MCQLENLEVLGSLWRAGKGVILTAKEAAIMEQNQEGLRQMGLEVGLPLHITEPQELFRVILVMKLFADFWKCCHFAHCYF